LSTAKHQERVSKVGVETHEEMPCGLIGQLDIMLQKTRSLSQPELPKRRVAT